MKPAQALQKFTYQFPQEYRRDLELFLRRHYGQRSWDFYQVSGGVMDGISMRTRELLDIVHAFVQGCNAVYENKIDLPAKKPARKAKKKVSSGAQ